jgi:hypothetical protein
MCKIKRAEKECREKREGRRSVVHFLRNGAHASSMRAVP